MSDYFSQNFISAAINGDEAAVELFFSKGANVAAVDEKGFTALHWAAKNGHVKVVELLLSKGVNVEAVDENGFTALHWAGKNGHEKVVELLRFAMRDLYTQFISAAINGDEKEVELLLSKGAKIDAVDENGYTALHWAANNGHEKVVELLLSMGANVAVDDEKGLTALHWAAKNGQEKVVELLLSKGANVEAVDENGFTALHWAAANGHDKVVEMLLSKGANVVAVSKNGYAALHWAAKNGHVKVVELLISNGANVEAVDENGLTALHCAAENGHENVVEVLLSNGANINAADKLGRTALIYAVLNENAKVALVLISNGADVKKTDNDERNALYYAKQKNLDKLMEILSEPEKAKYVASILLLESNSSRFGIDRLGVSPYAKAIYNVLSNADTPLCVGLFGRWGSGKSFLIQLIKYNFDKGVSLHPNSNELLQWYEEKWINRLKPDTISRISEESYIDRCKLRFICCCDAAIWCVAIIAGESSQYLIKLVRKLLCDEIRYLSCSLRGNIFGIIWKGLLFCYTGSVVYYPLESKNDDDIEKQKKETKNFQTEYVFVDFNAWEYSQSDELWAGLIRNIYTKVELRLQQHDSPRHRLVIQSEAANSLPRDWKEVWRIQKAEETLTKYYGGSMYLHARLWLVAVICIFLIIFIVNSGIVSMIYYKYFDVFNMHHPTQQQPMNSTTSFNQTTLQLVANEKHQFTLEDARTGFSIILSIIAIVAGAVPIKSFFSFVNQTVNISRGDAIFEEAKGLKDKIGFLSRVRAELQELFDFMKQYEHETRIKLKLVIFVDDLDRCLEGRNVKVLEAIQLILAIPGAPVICFLAIDSRVLVASIEKTINNSLAIEDALISGWEYLDKIVQIPFCLPDHPPEKVQRYAERCLTQPYDAGTIFQMLAAIVEKANYVRKSYPKACFRMKSLPNNEEGIISYNTFNGLLVSSKNSSVHIDLILDLAPMLLVKGERYRTLYQNSLKQKENTRGLDTNEIMEIMCRELFEIFQTAELDYISDSENNKPITPPNNTFQPNIPIDKMIVNIRSDFKDNNGDNIQVTPPNNTSQPIIPIDHMTVDDPFPNKLSPMLKAPTRERFRKDIINKFMKLDPSSQLPKVMSHMFFSLCKSAESNPRRFKRILNVAAIACQVALYKPVSEDSPELTVAEDGRWTLFSMKIAKWIFLSELYPYRMSFLVQMLNNYQHKEDFNKKVQSRNNGIQYVNNALFTTTGEKSFDHLLNLSIADFYYEHVEKYIYAISSAEKLLRLDSDPEQFALLLYSPLSYGDDSVSHICCRDVLGVDLVADTTNASFSLLSYSFNFNPSMSKQIGIELQEIITGYELGIPSKRNVISSNALRNDDNDDDKSKTMEYSSVLLRDGVITQKKKRIIHGEEDEKKRIVHEKKRNIHGEVDEETPLLSTARQKNYSSTETVTNWQ